MRTSKLIFNQLDKTTFPEFQKRIVNIEQEGITHEPRTYPGYPLWQLKLVKPRFLFQLDKTLLKRRSVRTLNVEMPSQLVLSRILQFSHGITGVQNQGPTPSSGGLQSIELYLVIFENSWINSGIYHYDRSGHYLSQISNHVSRNWWYQQIPSMSQFEGGAFLWVIVGDGARVEKKYGDRGFQFLFVEAGHLMQNLCLLSTSMNMCTLPLGGFFEQEIAKTLSLIATDVVLYTGVCGKI